MERHQLIFLLAIFYLFQKISTLPGQIVFDISQAIVLKSQIKFIKYLQNQSILIRYTNLSFIRYNRSYKYQNEINLINSSNLQNIKISPSQKYLIGHQKTSFSRTIISYYLLLDQNLIRTQTYIDLVWCDMYQNKNSINYVTIVQKAIYYKSFINGIMLNNPNYNLSNHSPTDLHNITKCVRGYQKFNQTRIFCYATNLQIFYIHFNHADITGNLDVVFTLTSSSISPRQIANTTITYFDYDGNNLVVQFIDQQIAIYNGSSFSIWTLNYTFTLQTFIVQNQNHFYLTSNGIYFVNNYYQQFSLIQRSSSIVFNNLNNASVSFNPVDQSYNVYQKGTSKIYHFSMCPSNQSYSTSGISGCLPINCLVVNCTICSFSNNICSVCNPNLQNKISECTPFNCPQANCLFCSNSTFCSQCNVGYNLTSTNQCQAVCQINNCLSCSDYLTCQYCLYGYNLIQNQCISNSNNQTSNINQQELNNVVLKVVQTSKIINSVPGLRNYLPILAPVFGFFDDFWYYIYQYNNLNGLQVTSIFLNIMYQVNQDRPFPKFIDTTSLQNLVDANANDYNKNYNYTDSNIYIIDEQVTYFQHNCRNLFSFQFLLTFCTIFFFALITKIWKCYKNSFNKITDDKIENKQHNQLHKQRTVLQIIIRNFFNFVEIKGTIKNFFNAMFQGNLMFLSFNIGAQIRIFHSYHHLNKFNLIMFISFGFVILCFVSTGYLFFGKITNTKEITKEVKKIAKNNKSTQQTNQQTQFQSREQCVKNTILIGAKSVLIGFVQSFLLNFNQVQLTCLILIKLIIIIFVLKKIITFQKSILKILELIYLLSSCCFDCMLLLSKTEIISEIIRIYDSSSYIKYIQFIIICLILLTVFAKTSIQLFTDLKHLISHNKQIKQNKDITIINQRSNDIKIQYVVKVQSLSKIQLTQENKINLLKFKIKNKEKIKFQQNYEKKQIIFQQNINKIKGLQRQDYNLKLSIQNDKEHVDSKIIEHVDLKIKKLIKIRVNKLKHAKPDINVLNLNIQARQQKRYLE